MDPERAMQFIRDSNAQSIVRRAESEARLKECEKLIAQLADQIKKQAEQAESPD